MFHMNKFTKVSTIILASSLLLIGCQSNDKMKEQEVSVDGQKNEDGEVKGQIEKYVGTVRFKSVIYKGTVDEYYSLTIDTGPQKPEIREIRVDEKVYNSVKDGDKGYLIISKDYYDKNGKYINGFQKFEKDNKVKDLDNKTLTKLYMERYLEHENLNKKEHELTIEGNQITYKKDERLMVVKFKSYGIAEKTITTEGRVVVQTYGPDGMETEEETAEVTIFRLSLYNSKEDTCRLSVYYNGEGYAFYIDGAHFEMLVDQDMYKANPFNTILEPNSDSRYGKLIISQRAKEDGFGYKSIKFISDNDGLTFINIFDDNKINKFQTGIIATVTLDEDGNIIREIPFPQLWDY